MFFVVVQVQKHSLMHFSLHDALPVQFSRPFVIHIENGVNRSIRSLFFFFNSRSSACPVKRRVPHWQSKAFQFKSGQIITPRFWREAVMPLMLRWYVLTLVSSGNAEKTGMFFVFVCFLAAHFTYSFTLIHPQTETPLNALQSAAVQCCWPLNSSSQVPEDWMPCLGALNSQRLSERRALLIHFTLHLLLLSWMRIKATMAFLESFWMSSYRSCAKVHDFGF